jgi:hypothetical protein
MHKANWSGFAIAALCLPVVAFAQDSPAKQERVLAAALERQSESRQLLLKATEITVSIGKLAASGKLPQDQEATKLMKSMVETLEGIHDRLKEIDEEIEGIKGWIKGQDEKLPKIEKDVSDLKKTKISGYTQFQYRDNDQVGGATDAFAFRRIRLGLAHALDTRTRLKVTMDLAQNAGGVSNNTAVTLKDAILTYDIEPTLNALVGQMTAPLGYELERSSSDREFPERSQYNRVMFEGERLRGLNFKKSVGEGFGLQAGLWNALSANDPETRDVTGSTGNKLGVTAGVRYAKDKFDAGLSGFWSSRAPRQAGYNGGTQTRVFSEEIEDRRFYYADLGYTGLFLPGLFVRAEGMLGFDRVPLSVNGTSTGSANSGVSDPNDRRLSGRDMAGYHLLLGYSIDARNVLALRYEQFDPDLDRGGNLFSGYGASYVYNLNKGVRFTLAHEIFEDRARASLGDQRYGVTTIRVQFKF